MGIRYLSIDQNLKEKLKLPVDYGALIASEEHAIAPTARLLWQALKKRHSLEVNGEKITSDKPMQDLLENLTVGEIIKLKVLRDGKTWKLK